ncbi:hypothetical protein H7E67_11725 [Clostridium gasigenes]|uniref:hypothetical protein n=1 Tax=Clostridium gasigenes TaxID=94869 RepID=UPI001624349A|nr:hypothetical protein [Clostridium gasigenes]MBB6624098.1 hypothetical protein [Clostridium gasigenes]
MEDYLFTSHYQLKSIPHPNKNVLVRNFSTSCPFDKMITDVTEYKVDGKNISPHWNIRRICG